MTSTEHGLARLICGAGGVLLIVSLFLPWTNAAGVDRNGWELWTMADVFLLVCGVVAVTAGVTGGRFGLFRPDMSLNGAADLLGVVAAILLTWLVLFDFPEGAGRELGVYLALASAVAIMSGAGDYSTLRGAPLFPRTDAGEPVRPSSPA